MHLLTQPLGILGLAVAFCLVGIIVLPLFVRWIDQQLGYVILAIGGGMLWLSLRLHLVQFGSGCFIQIFLDGRQTALDRLLLESWVLIACYFLLSLLASVFHRQIKRSIRLWARKMSPPMMIFLWVLLAGSLGSLSVVVLSVIGAIFFSTLSEVTGKDYTPCIVVYAAALGLSALLTTIGEPLSLFIAHAIGGGTPYLLRTFGATYVINILCLSSATWFLAKRARHLPGTVEERMIKDVHRAERAMARERNHEEVKEALRTVEEFEEEKHDFSHTLDQILHSTTKLYFFVVGLLFFGEATKPIVVEVFSHLSPLAAFFGNAISAVADNALLGLLEIQPGMPQSLVFVLGISLALWGVGLVPGNVCNVVLKEKLSIPFKRWAMTGIPCACALALLNVSLYESGIARWLMF